MTTQEWLFFGLALPATLGAIYCLRRRPEFGAIQKMMMLKSEKPLSLVAVVHSYPWVAMHTPKPL